MTEPSPRALGFLTAEFRLARGDFELDAVFRVAGGVTGVFGPSGAGKSTLLRCLAGLESDSRGRVQLDGECWQDTAQRIFLPPHRRGVGMVFQDSRLFDHLDVRANLEYGYRRSAAAGRRLHFEQIVRWLDLGELLARAPASLSGGERQRVALGRALLAQPRLLLLDEPLAALDRRRKQETLPYLRRLRDELAIPILYVSHHLDELAQCADQLLLVEGGRVVAAGPLAELLARVDLPPAQGDDAGALLEAVVMEHDDVHHLSYLGVGTQRLTVGRDAADVGSVLRLRIRARDVALSLEPPRHSTLLNIVAARIRDIVPAPQAGQTLVRLDVDGHPLLARITTKSAVALALGANMPVYALVKGVALMR